MKGRKVFISGGAGVIGKALVNTLLDLGAELYVADLKSEPADWRGRIRYRQGDLNFITKQELESFSPELFFHLAATFERSTETYDFWDENFEHNVQLSHHLMTCIKDIPTLKRIVFASSYLIYDSGLYSFSTPAKHPVSLKESDRIQPRNLCGVAKLLHEIELSFLQNFNHNNFSTISARIFRVYGKNSNDIISRWIRTLINGDPIKIYKKEGFFDYIYADEVAEGLIQLALGTSTGIVNLGNGRARRVEEVIDILYKYFPDMEKQYEHSDIAFEASEANMDSFKKATGYTPKKRLEDAIPIIIDYERDKIMESIHKSSSDFNILITSISKKVSLLNEVQNAAKKLRLGKVIGADIDPHCTGSYFVDDFWEMPALTKLTINDMIDYCKKNDVNAIIPTRDGELAYFSNHKKELNEAGIHVMVSNADGISVCLDKLLFYEHSKMIGYPAIQTSTNINDIKATNFVVKERYGAGSHNIGLNLSKEQALIHGESLSHPIYQPYIEGQELSIDLYVDINGKTKGVIARSRDIIVNGESQVTTTFKNDEIEQICSRFVEDLGLYGHVVIQLIINNGMIQIIECNSRFGGASRLSIQCGLDTFYWFLLESNGTDLKDYKFNRSLEERKLVRYAQDLIL